MIYPRLIGMSYLQILIVLLIFHRVQTLPVPSTEGCPALECTGDEKVLSFKAQNAYVYKLEAETEQSASGLHSTQGKSDQGRADRLHYRATITVSAITPCQLGVAINSIHLTGSDKKDIDANYLLGKPIVINMQNGELHPTVCTDPKEDMHTLNLKRAIASFLQVPTTNKVYTDIYGNCPIEVKVSKGGEGITMYNSYRDLMKCQNREKIIAGFSSTHYSVKSDTQAIPLLSAVSKLQQKVKNGILEAATSHEVYNYLPFSGDEPSAVIQVHASLTLEKKQTGVKFTAPANNQASSIIFEAPHSSGVKATESQLDTAFTKAKSLMGGVVNKGATHAFKELVNAIRSSEKETLFTQFKPANSAHDEKVYIDALIAAGTGDAINVLLSLLKSGKLKTQQPHFIRSLPFARHPDLEVFKNLNTILAKPAQRELILAAGSVVNNYLSQPGHIADGKINGLIDTIGKPLSNCLSKSKNQENQNQILTAMKAIHNAHHMTQSVAEKLKECATNKKVPLRVRSASLDAMLGVPSNKIVKQASKEILEDLEEDSELRIKAYNVFVSCPCSVTAKTVAEVLEKEKVNQVGAYIISHIRNLRSSSNPEKLESKQYFDSINLPTHKFPIDLRKYSSNTELSYLFNKINTAATGELDVIYSQKSFLPRSANFNFTTNFFGHSFNLLEVGVRQENLESLLEKYFGPKGILKNLETNEYITKANETAKELASKVKTHFQNTLRAKRALKDDVKKLDPKVQMLDDTDNINLDMYLKIFGHELSFFDYHGDPTSLNPSKIIDQIFERMNSGLDSMKDLKYDGHYHGLLHDVELVYPTATGFPLKLTSSSIATLNLVTESKFDFRSFVRDPKNIDISFKIIPSGAIELESTLEVDFLTIACGLQHEATVHSSTGTNLKYKLIDGKKFDLEFRPTSKKQEFNLISNVFAINKNKGDLVHNEIKLQFPSKSQNYKGCYDNLNTMTSLQFCYDVTYPQESGLVKRGSYFPLNGVYSFNVALEKDDDELNVYRIKGAYEDSDPNRRAVSITYETDAANPGRSISFIAEASVKPNYELKTALTAPMGEISAGVKFINTKDEHSIHASARFIEQEILGSLGLKVLKSTANRVEYEPILKITDHTGTEVVETKVDGKVIMEKKSTDDVKYSFKKLKASVKDSSYMLDGYVHRMKQQYDIDIKGENSADSVNIKSNGKWGDHNPHVYLETKLSQYPDFAFSIDYELKYSEEMLGNSIKIHHGIDLKDPTKCLTISQYGHCKNCKDHENFDFETKNLISYPAYDVKLQIDSDATPKHFSYNIEGGFDAKRVSSDMDIKFRLPGPEGQQRENDIGGYELKFNVDTGGKTVEINSHRHITELDKSQLHFDAKILPNGIAFKIDSDVIHRTLQNDVKLMATTKLEIEGHPTTYSVCTGVENTLKHNEGHFKFSRGDDLVISVLGKGIKGDPCTGTFNILLKGYLDGKGSYKYSIANSEGSFDATFDSAKLSRTFEAKGTVKPGSKATSRKGTLEILLDAKNDPGKKIFVETDVDLAKDRRTYDTKTVLNMYSKIFKLNLKGIRGSTEPTETGVYMKFDGLLEIPSGQKFTLYSDAVQIQNKNGVNSKFKFDDGQGSKIIYDGKYTKVATTATKIPIYDINAKLDMEVPGKKKVSTVAILINKDSSTEFKIDLTGNIIPQPTHVGLSFDHVRDPNFNFKANYGKRYETEVKFKTLWNDGKRKAGDLEIEAKTDVEGYESIKFDSHFNSDIEIGRWHIAAKENLFINDKRKYSVDCDWNHRGEKENVQGRSEMKLLLGPDDNQARTLLYEYENNGVKLFEINLNKAQNMKTSVQYKHGDENLSLKLKGSIPGDGTQSSKISIEAATPIKGYEIMNVYIDKKSDASGKKIESKIDYQLGENSYEVNGEVDLSDSKREFYIDIRRANPRKNDPILHLKLKVDRSEDSEFKSQLELICIEKEPLDIDINTHIKYPGGIDNFEAKISLNSKTLAFKNIIIELATEPSKNGRQIVASAKSAEKNYFQAKTSYNKKEDGDTITYEGKGNVKVGDESRNSNFKYVMKKLTKEKDQETGIQSSLNVDVAAKGKQGKLTFEAVAIISDRTLRIFDKYCPKADECASLEIQNKFKVDDVKAMDIENIVALDIKRFFNVVPFRFNGKFKNTAFDFEHTVLAQLGTGDKLTKYKYELFNKNNKGGLHLTLPKRVIAVDTVLLTPADFTDKPNTKNYKLETTIAFDKLKNPDQKMVITAESECSKGRDGPKHGSFDLTISHPLLARDVTFGTKTVRNDGNIIWDSTVTIDVFEQDNKAVVFEIKTEKVPVNDGNNITNILSIKSLGQNIDISIESHFIATRSEFGFGTLAEIRNPNMGDVSSGLLFSASKENMLFLAHSPTCELIRIEGDCNMKSGKDHVANFKLILIETLALIGKMQGYSHLKVDTYDTAYAERVTAYTVAYEPEKQILVQSQYQAGGKSANLFKFKIALDTANFLKLDQQINNEEVKAGLNRLQLSEKNAVERIRTMLADVTRDAEIRFKTAMDSIKKSEINVKPLLMRIREEYFEFQEEIQSDLSAKEMIDLIKSFVTSIAQLITKAAETLTSQLEKIREKIREIGGKISEFITKISPSLTESLTKITKAFVSLFSTFIEIFTRASARIVEIWKENSADINKIVGVFVEFINEQTKQMRKVFAEFRIQLEDLYKNIKEKIMNFYGDEYKEIVNKITEYIQTATEGLLPEIVEVLKSISPNDDFSAAIDKAYQYITKKINNEATDDLHDLEEIYKILVKAVRQLLNLSDDVIGTTSFKKWNIYEYLRIPAIPVTIDQLINVPKLFNFRFSIFELLTTENLPSAADLLTTYVVPREIDDICPPHKAIGQLFASKHFITFDNNHFTLNGDCQYLLARDFDDGNFSLVAELAGGKLISITMIDSKDSVKLKADHSVLVNEKTVELPVQHNDMAVFRTLRTINIMNKAGVRVSCDLTYDLCTFEINGYYFGKTRGLLGTITNERYDDLALPNGKIAQTVQDFANAYKLSETCVNQAPVTHQHNHHQECTDIFTQRNLKAACFLFVDPLPYRQACDDALDFANSEAEKQQAICNALTAYTVKCRDITFLQPKVPSMCTKCTIEDKSVAAEDSATVVMPQKAADILVFVEQRPANEETFTQYFMPVAKSLTEELKSKGLTDVRIALIGFGGQGQKWPKLFTSNGKFVFDGKKPSQLKFDEIKREKATSSGSQHPFIIFLKAVREFSSVEFAKTIVIEQLLEYPFRPEAAKSVMIIRSSECDQFVNKYHLHTMLFMAIKEYLADKGIVPVVIQPVQIDSSPDLKIFGFDHDNAFTLGKKAVDSSLREAVDYSQDSCNRVYDWGQPSVFNSKAFKEAPKDQKKKMIQVTSARIASILTSNERTQTCKCTTMDGIYPCPNCKVSTIKEVKVGGKKKN